MTGRRGAAGLAGAAVALSALAVLGWEWRHPDVLVHNLSTGTYNQVGTVAWLGAGRFRSDSDTGTITVHAAEPRVVAGRARVEVLVCHLDEGDPGIGTARGRLTERHCRSHEPAAGARMDADDQLLLRVEAAEPTRVRVRGIEVTYSAGWRRGTQLVGHAHLAVFGTQPLGERGDGRAPKF